MWNKSRKQPTVHLDYNSGDISVASVGRTVGVEDRRSRNTKRNRSTLSLCSGIVEVILILYRDDSIIKRYIPKQLIMITNLIANKFYCQIILNNNF